MTYELTDIDFEPAQPEIRTALNRRADELRAQYGRAGFTVYDRLDRWRDEHRLCKPYAHESGVERMIYVIHCRDRGAVAVCESWQFTEH